MYRIAICDDEKLYRKKLKEYLLQNKDLKNQIEIYEYEDGKDLIADVEQIHDLIFLDIQMNGLDGNKTAKLLRERNKCAVLVFCTNYYSITPETIKVRPFRYVVKDLRDKNLQSELSDIIAEVRKETQIRYVTVTGQECVRRIPIKDILYISIIKHGAEVCVYEGNGSIKVKCKETVRELYSQLKDEGFEYAHNSYIVNILNIVGKDKHVIKLKDNSELNIARSRKNKFEEKMFDVFHSRRYE